MFGIISSALAVFGRFLASKAFVATIIFSAFFYIIESFAGFLSSANAGNETLAGQFVQGFNLISSNPHMAFLLYYFNIAYGFKICFASLGARFLIRRIPVFG